jgi:hypothetical protein
MDLLGALGIQGVYILVTIMLVALLIASADRFHAGPEPVGSGQGSLAFEGRLPPPFLVAMPALPVDELVQEAEVRQMLEAKSYRRQRRGEPALDIDAEMAHLLDASESPSPSLEGMLRAEIRELVVSRNERRLRRGKEPLDVEAETDRQLADFTGLAR